MSTEKLESIFTDDVIRGYLLCYDDLGLSDIERFSQMFDLLDTHSIINGNGVVDGKIGMGIKVTPDENKSKFPADRSWVSKVNGLLSSCTDEKETAFISSVVRLAKATEYMNPQERFTLSVLFGEINISQISLNNPVDLNGASFYPYNYQVISKKNKR